MDEKEQFLKSISSIPSWVREQEDFVSFSRHLQYRLFQAEAQLDYVNKVLKKLLNVDDFEEEQIELMEITKKFDEWYNNE